MEEQKPKKITFSWPQFWHYAEEVALQIINEKKTYTQIIVILRGGFYLGDYLSRRLDIPLSALVTQSYNSRNQQENLSISELSYTITPTERVLLVDDLLDSGETMIKVKQKLETNWNVEIDTAVIWQKFHSQCQADYFYSFIPSDLWIIQPFEKAKKT